MPAAQLKTLAELGEFIEDTYVSFILVDDFVGSGDQAVATWKNIVGLLNSKQRPILAVHVAFKEGIDHILAETRLRVVFNTLLSESNKVFSPENKVLTTTEKEKLLKYCYLADEYPEGYGKMQANISFYYRAPDNCISVLCSNNPRWKGLFPRKI